jgi:hypothetical protein
MERMLERLYKGTFRSYKVFRRTGDVKLHSSKAFQEIDINDNKVLTINIYKDHTIKTLVQTNRWNIELKNKRHFLYIDKNDAYEVITINHTGMVLADRTTEEKTFYARLHYWENLINNGITSAL